MKKEMFILLIIVLIAGIIIHGCRKDKEKKEIITLPKNCEILKANDTLSFNFDPFAKQIKDVILIKDVNGVICELRNWIPYIKKYPRYPFLFYIQTDSKERLLEYLRAMEFPIPVFVKPLKRTKMQLIAYRVNEDNEVIELTNPTLSTFKPFLQKNKDKYGVKK